jgi:4-hydroxymandelate oxidase
MAPADPPSTVPGACGLRSRSADAVGPAVLDPDALEERARASSRRRWWTTTPVAPRPRSRSTSASTALADVAATEPASPKWVQLYRLHSPAHTEDLARRAGQAGYRALVLTVDLPVLGLRLRDVATPAGTSPAR